METSLGDSATSLLRELKNQMRTEGGGLLPPYNVPLLLVVSLGLIPLGRRLPSTRSHERPNGFGSEMVKS